MYNYLLLERIYYSEITKDIIREIIKNIQRGKKSFFINKNTFSDKSINVTLVNTRRFGGQVLTAFQDKLIILMLNKHIFTNIQECIRILIHEISHILFLIKNPKLYNTFTKISLIIKQIKLFLNKFKNKPWNFKIKFLNAFRKSIRELYTYFSRPHEFTAWIHTLEIDAVSKFKNKEEFLEKTYKIIKQSETLIFNINNNINSFKNIFQTFLLIFREVSIEVFLFVFLAVNQKKIIYSVIKKIYNNFDKIKGYVSLLQKEIINELSNRK